MHAGGLCACQLWAKLNPPRFAIYTTVRSTAYCDNGCTLCRGPTTLECSAQAPVGVLRKVALIGVLSRIFPYGVANGWWRLHRFACRFGCFGDCAASAAQVLDRGGCTLLRFPSATRIRVRFPSAARIRVRSAQLLTPRRIGAHFCFGLIADWVAVSCRVWRPFLPARYWSTQYDYSSGTCTRAGSSTGT